MADATTPLYLQCEIRTASLDPQTLEWTIVGDVEEDAAPETVRDAHDGARVIEIRDVSGVQADGNDDARVAVIAVVREGAEPKPFNIDYQEKLVDIGGEEPVDLSEFQTSAFRCDSEGAYVTTFLDPLWKQVKACEAAGAEAHVAEIHAAIDTMRDSDNAYVQIDWRVFDIAVSGMTDGMTTEEVLAQSRFRNDAPLHAVHGLDSLQETEIVHYEAGYFDEDGNQVDQIDADEYGAVFQPAHDEEEVVFSLSNWNEIREYPQYMIDGVRAMFRNFMADRIGATPIEGISRIQKRRGEVENICRLLDKGGFEYQGKSRPFADAARVMGRPYETSDVVSYKGNGLDLIVFEDFAGAYAYAWPEQPKPALVSEAALRA